ncbi:nitroreductase/quinone reductase family protein [Nocardia sp. CDC159]|uniref:Nitroreductase/quinone reductase family protein n=1 Tax=Nocardia pulmonis TaxID=2951408 RepID=A0A9X2E8M9_9NOCA|nr:MULTISPECIES: nitroreductase/quinone reductase family protein [Nocardia]MCM6775625.1 nitroreductase/quinone reductase family protein [Nocardia pulmonis]MCM6787641.1 nitroreductase/quinone reductase family protein [Nocardia sp. CDC159]
MVVPIQGWRSGDLSGCVVRMRISGGFRKNSARSLPRWLGAAKRWMYRDGRPNRVMRVLNWVSGLQYSAGFLSPRYAMTLEVRGRRSGRPVTVPIAVAELDGHRYLVSMLGPEADWVRNVRASGGRAVLHRCGSEMVRLEEVAADARAPILRRYLAIAPGARPHFPVDRHAPLAEFEKITERYPVFEVTSAIESG